MCRVLILVPAVWAAGAALFALPWHTFLAAVVSLAAVTVHPAYRAPGVSRRIRLLLGIALILMAVAIAAYVHSWQQLPEAGLPGFDRAVLERITDPDHRHAQLAHDVVLAAALTLAGLCTGAAFAHLPPGRLRFVPGAAANRSLAALAIAAFLLVASVGGAWSTVSGELGTADRWSAPDALNVEVSAVSVAVGTGPGPDIFAAATIAGWLAATVLAALGCARLAVNPPDGPTRDPSA